MTGRTKFRRLTPRETEILQLASTGMTDKGIAHALGLSVSTINTYWIRIRLKLGTSTRGESIAIAAKAQVAKELEVARTRFDEMEAEVKAEMEEVARAEARFRALIEAVPDGVLIVGDSFRIQDANSMALELLGRTRKEVIGLDVMELVPDRFKERHATHQTEYIASPRKRPMGSGIELFARHKDGTEIPIDAKLYPQDIAGETIVVVVVRPLPQQKKGRKRRATGGI